jgi:GntR family transcriptional regulator
VSDRPQLAFLPPVSPADGPLYQQIIDGLRREISEGRLPAGASLPSFRQLAEDLRVSLITVKRAYDELERDGLIVRRQGLGTFVAHDGGRRGRLLKARRARELLHEAMVEARQAGLTSAEIKQLFRDAQQQDLP